jgi:hypothetical protein
MPRRQLGKATQPQPENVPPLQPLARHLYRRFCLHAMIYVVAAYIAWIALLYFFWQDKIIFPAHLAAGANDMPDRTGTFAIKLDIETGGQIEAWFMPAQGVTAQKPGPVVMFFHGNAETIAFLDEIIEGYLHLGCSVFLPEYRGYGGAAGRPSQKAICADAVRFYDELIKRADVDPSRIVFHGRSLGGAVAANLAVRRKPAALILQSTFKSVAGMAWRFGVPPFLVRHPFRTDRAIAHCAVPVLIFHGTRDEIIPVAHGRRLRDLAPKAVYIEYDCGHNDFPGQGNDEAYWAAIKKFLSRNEIVKE